MYLECVHSKQHILPYGEFVSYEISTMVWKIVQTYIYVSFRPSILEIDLFLQGLGELVPAQTKVIVLVRDVLLALDRMQRELAPDSKSMS